MVDNTGRSDPGHPVSHQVSSLKSKVSPALALLLPPVVALGVLLGGWEAYVRLAGVDAFVLPPPSSVLRRFGEDFRMLGREGLTATLEALGGFALGAGVAWVAAALMAASRPLERALFPIAVLVKVTH